MTRSRLSSTTVTAQVEAVQMVEPADAGGGDGEVPAAVVVPMLSAVCWEVSTGWARAGWRFGADVCAPRWLR